MKSIVFAAAVAVAALFIGTAHAAAAHDCPTTCDNGGVPNPSTDMLTCCSCPALYAQPNCSFLLTEMVPIHVVGANKSNATHLVRFSTTLFADNVRNVTGFEYSVTEYMYMYRPKPDAVPKYEDVDMIVEVQADLAWAYVQRVRTSETYGTLSATRNAWYVGPKADSIGGPFSRNVVVLFYFTFQGYLVPVEGRAMGYFFAGIAALLLFPLVEVIMRSCCGSTDNVLDAFMEDVMGEGGDDNAKASSTPRWPTVGAAADDSGSQKSKSVYHEDATPVEGEELPPQSDEPEPVKTAAELPPQADNQPEEDSEQVDAALPGAVEEQEEDAAAAVAPVE
jgi:hypothetical protein